MIEFNKCPDCGAEIAAEDEKCPVCGSAAPENGGGTGAFEPRTPPRPKKSAFTPRTGGGIPAEGGGARQPDYQIVFKPPLSWGAIALMIVFGLLGLALSFCAAGFAAFLFIFSNSGWHGGGAHWVPEIMAVMLGVSFVTVSCLVGLCIGYNTGAYLSIVTGLARSQPGFVSFYSMVMAYAASMACGLILALAACALDPPPSSVEFFAALSVLAALGSGIYAMLNASRRE